MGPRPGISPPALLVGVVVGLVAWGVASLAHAQEAGTIGFLGGLAGCFFLGFPLLSLLQRRGLWG